MANKYRSAALAVVHETAAELHRASGIDEKTMRKFDDLCLTRDEQPEQAGKDRHPSGQPWPRRNPVGGIITPV